jgi:hypothetical protein
MGDGEARSLQHLGIIREDVEVDIPRSFVD